MAKIKTAIFPVGGLGTRFLPATKAMPKEMLPVVDKPLIQYAVEEAAEAGIEQFIFVTGRGKSAIEDHFDHSFELEHALTAHGKEAALSLSQSMLQKPGAVTYVRQQEPAGLGHAVWCARHLVKDEAVAILLADDLIYTGSESGCLSQMIARYESSSVEGGNMVALMEVKPEDTQSYGIVKPNPHFEYVNGLVEVRGLVEKPRPGLAPSHLAVVGRYIVEPGVFNELESQERGTGNEIQLTDSLAKRVGQVPFHGLLFKGERFDCGSKLGFLKANIAYAMQRDDLANPLKSWLKANTL
ncbi:MAG: UTP--glucose-1-phosphate uridylyltransferase [Myxococcales bacterium]|nr:UTP--glucose-1-phosphate uridylyltransferase [Myxococcales bacterium]